MASSKKKDRIYIAIDLKSFYASVECMERNLDPLTTNLVVADVSRTEKTICLAVSPALKSYGIPGRARLFEVVQKVKEINGCRLRHAPGHKFSGSSFIDTELKKDSSLSLDYIAAPPQMAYYMEYSTKIYNIYLKYIAPEDIHVYSIDEVFIDATDYLATYKLTAKELAQKIILDVLNTTGITATVGIGTNLYLAKIAMDVMAKHIAPDKNGVRIAELDEMSYRLNLWDHRPITDFWRIGKGYKKKLEANFMYTMGDIARCSIGADSEYLCEDLLYKLFGVNAELLIDHAWGYEPCTISDVKSYKPSSSCLSSGQVLQTPYPVDKARLIITEMADLLALDLVDKALVTDQIILDIGYDIDNLTDEVIKHKYKGEITSDLYGRKMPKPAHGSENIGKHTSSTKMIVDATLKLFDRIDNPDLLVRKLSITAAHLITEDYLLEKENTQSFKQIDLFSDIEEVVKNEEAEKETFMREKRIQKAVIDLKKKYGKNAILKGMNLEEGATTIQRNQQIGGHKA